MDPYRLTSLERSLRLLKTWNVVLTVLLLASLGANAAWLQAAADPPIRVFGASADDAGGGGSFAEGDMPVLSEYTLESPLTLVSVNTSHLSRNHGHTCLVTASAKVYHPTNPSSGIVIVGLSMGRSREIHPPTERWVHLVATPDDDQEMEEVTTTFAFTGVRRNQTIRFSAAYYSMGIQTVANPSMTVVCLRNPI